MADRSVPALEVKKNIHQRVSIGGRSVVERREIAGKIFRAMKAVGDIGGFCHGVCSVVHEMMGPSKKDHFLYAQFRELADQEMCFFNEHLADFEAGQTDHYQVMHAILDTSNKLYGSAGRIKFAVDQAAAAPNAVNISFVHKMASDIEQLFGKVGYPVSSYYVKPIFLDRRRYGRSWF